MNSEKVLHALNQHFFKLLLLIIAFMYTGCANKTVEPDFSEFGFEYYPLHVGAYSVYYTQVIHYKLDGSTDTLRYLVKEVVEDSIIYTDGSLRFLLGRYSAAIGSNNWQKDSLWAVNSTNATVVVSEANLDFIKLAFPVFENKQWDGNALNSRDREDYIINELGKPYSYDTLTYANTLTVVHADFLDPVKITKDDYRVEVFAANIGLIYKINLKIKYCSSCIENGKIEDGIVFEQKLIEFGKE